MVAFFSETDEDYFLRLEVEDIVWQLEAALSHDLEADGPLVRVRTYTQAGGAHEGATQVFIFAHDQANLCGDRRDPRSARPLCSRGPGTYHGKGRVL